METSVSTRLMIRDASCQSKFREAIAFYADVLVKKLHDTYMLCLPRAILTVAESLFVEGKIKCSSVDRGVDGGELKISSRWGTALHSLSLFLHPVNVVYD